MSSEGTSQRQGMAPATKVIIGIICLAVAIGIIFWIFKGKTTTVKTGSTNYADSSTLSCTASNIENGTFDTRNADYTTYDFNIIFHDDKIYNLTYTFNGKYPNAAAATTAEAVMHADFNISLVGSGLQNEAFSSSNWSVDGNEVNISIFANRDEILPGSADELMLDVEDKDTPNPKIPTTLKEVKDNYTKRGFVCKEQN